MSTNSMSRVRALAALAAVGTLAFAASPALADDFVLAVSKAHKLQVLAEGGAAWCGQHLRLRMMLEKDSPDLGNASAQVDIMNRLKTPITTDCTAATSADLIVVEPAKAPTAYKATAQQGWTFAAAPKPDDTKAAAATSPPPAPVTEAAPPAPTSSPSPSPAAAAPAPAPQPQPLPRRLDYYSAMLRANRDNPALVEDEGVVRFWAAHRFRDEYNKYERQEFKLRPILQKAKADLAEAIADARFERVSIVLGTQFGSYDFDNHRFPITLRGTDVKYDRPCCMRPDLPSSYVVELPDLKAISYLPMGSATARAFTERRTRYGSVDRSIAVAVTVKLDAAGFKSMDRWSTVIFGDVEEVVFYADNQLKDPLYRMGAEEFAKIREAKKAEKAATAQAEKERMAEQRRQQILAQREQAVRALSSAPTSVKLANWISDGQIDTHVKLNNLRAARAEALVGGKPVMVSMLVQASGSGRNKVDTRWPGKLEVTIAEGQPDLSSSGWYLVRGLLSVPDGDSLPPAQLTAQTVYACVKPKCADATDATAIVDRKLAELIGAN